MFIQYINKLPSKIEFFDMLRTLTSEQINISELDLELSETITAVCAYNGDRIVGIGRVKKEGNYLYIQDVIITLEYLKEEIEKNIIINLIQQINQMKQFNVEIRDCLEMPSSKSNFYDRYNFLTSDIESAVV